MLSRADVERIVENVLKELKLSVTDSKFNSTDKQIDLKYKDVVISTTTFSTHHTKE